MDKHMNQLSIPLYRILVNVGASEKMRTFHQQTATSKEILASVHATLLHKRGKTRNIYFCGSSYEGTVTPDLASDLDLLECDSDEAVVLDAEYSPPGHSRLMVFDRWTPPGYCKLQFVLDKQPLTDWHVASSETFGIDHAGRACFKHIVGDNMSGPARMTVDINGVHILDHVYSHKCDIPPSYLQWILRSRPYNWPSKEQLDMMARQGCMVVGVGHEKSSEHEIEWRLSFNLQERMLMRTLNPVQHKVYILLKMMKRDIFRDVFHEESLTSYHFKTCVFYAVQMTPARMWTPGNLINCLMLCLKLMTRWLKAGQCPSFLVKDQNLFAKEGFIRARRRLLGVMSAIFQWGRHALYVLRSDNVGTILREGDWRRLRKITFENKIEYVFKIKERNIRGINFDIMPFLRNVSDGRFDPFSLAHALEILQNNQQINGHSADDTYYALEYLFPWLHLHIAKGLGSISITCEDDNLKTRLQLMTDFHLHAARGADLVNSRLARATLMYANEKFEECCLLLQQLEHAFTHQVIVHCPCTRHAADSSFCFQNQHRRNRAMLNMPLRQIAATMITCCVVFLPSAAAIVPEPLQYEMQRSIGTAPGTRVEKNDFWFDWAVMDAEVYLYFLKYLTSAKLHRDVYKNIAMDSIRAMVLDDGGHWEGYKQSVLAHRDTDYNILGWIYMQEEQFTEAYSCFKKSWMIRPLHNAAKYHMRDLAKKVSERNRSR